MSGILERMRDDWNQRAREDAHYYVAFGRRDQDDAEFFASAADVIRELEGELKRLRGCERALEIGCGPGRLLRPMAYHFGELHGVDVSDEMVARARHNLRNTPNVQAHAGNGTDLSLFPDEHFEFVWSYAVFQHIPSRDVVFRYLSEACRVLRTGAVMKVQLNGLPKTAAEYTTWSGVRIDAGEIQAFCRDHHLQLLALDGIDTQYMWMTARKRKPGWRNPPPEPSLFKRILAPAAKGPLVRVRAFSNAYSGENCVPAGGPFAAVSFWLDGLSPDADLLNVAADFEGRPGRPTCVGHPMHDGLTQVNFVLPEVRTGLVPVRLSFEGQPLCPPVWIRVIPPGPLVPRLVSLTDGVNLLAGTRIENGCVKAVFENFPGAFDATVDGLPVREIDIFRTDPMLSRYEINFHLPEGIHPGERLLVMRLGERTLPGIPLQVTQAPLITPV